MLRRESRPLFLLLLILLFVAPMVVFAAPDLQVTITHSGTSGNNFLTGSDTGTVSVAIQNAGADPTAGDITVTVTLDGGLSYHAFGSSTPGSLFTTCTGTTTVTCTTSGVIAAGATETLTFSVNAPTDAERGSLRQQR